jgi:hypothetical protein
MEDYPLESQLSMIIIRIVIFVNDKDFCQLTSTLFTDITFVIILTFIDNKKNKFFSKIKFSFFKLFFSNYVNISKKK